MKTRKAVIVVAVAAGLLGPAGHSAYALGLGKLVVESALDEPFRGAIAVTAVTVAEFDTLSVRLGSPDDFARAGVLRSPALTLLQFDPVRGSRGDARIRVSSEVPTHEPYIQFLVAVEWAGGQMIREYTALLNPRGYTVQRPTPVSAPAGSVAPQSSGVTAPPAPVAPTAVPRGASPDVDEWRVQRGETLWRIAERTAPSRGANVYQMMVALFRDNPRAFSNNDINNLRADSVLRVPDPATATALSRGAAHQEFADLVAAPAPSLVASDPIPVTPAVAVESGADAAPVPAVPADPVAVAPATQDQTASADVLVAGETTVVSDDEARLRITGADGDAQTPPENEDATTEGGATSAETVSQVSESIQALQGRIAMLEEAVLSKDLENQELRDRLLVLEDQFQNRSGMLDLEQPELALVQQQFADNATAPATGELQGTGAGVAETTPGSSDADRPDADEGSVDGEVAVEGPVAAAESATQAPDPAAMADTDAAATAMKADSAPDAGAAQRSSEPAPGATRTRSQGVMSWWGDLSRSLLGDSSRTLLAGAGVLVVGLGMLLFVRRRRGRHDANDDMVATNAMPISHGLTPDGSRIATPAAVAPEPAPRRIDPLAEADVYIAYGRDVEAQQVLQDALTANPDQPELQLKLLEIYKRRGDADAFRTGAKEFRSRWGTERPDLWQQVVRQGGGLLAVDELSDIRSEQAADEAEAPQTSSSGEPGVGDAVPHVPAAESVAADAGAPELERFDTGESGFLVDYAQPPVAPVRDEASDPVDQPDTQPPGDGHSPSETAVPGAADDGPDAGSVAWDSIGTKLDLARAYTDMGDLEYARGLIDEVVKQGSEEQRAQAARLIEQIKSMAEDSADRQP